MAQMSSPTRENAGVGCEYIRTEQKSITTVPDHRSQSPYPTASARIYPRPTKGMIFPATICLL